MGSKLFFHWERYLVIKFISLLCLALFGIYALYITLDYSTHLKIFLNHSIPFDSFCQYYLAHIVRRAPLIIPCCVMIAAMGTFQRLRQQGELLILLTSGYSPRRILRGPLVIALLLMAGLYGSQEWLEPPTMRYINEFEAKYFDQSQRPEQHTSRFLGQKGLHFLHLQNNAYAVYQWYDETTQFFYDLYFLPNLKEVYHIQSLQLLSNGEALGHGVDKFNRNEMGTYAFIENIGEKHFTEFNLTTEELDRQLISLDYLSLTELAQEKEEGRFMNFAQGQRGFSTSALFMYKVLLPLFILLALFIPARLLCSANRHLSSFVTYLVGLFILLSGMMLTNTAYLLTDVGILHYRLFGMLFLLFWGIGMVYLYLTLGPLVRRVHLAE